MIIKDYVLQIKKNLKEEISSFSTKPHLLIIQVNDDLASNTYIKGKLNDANEIGAKASLLKLDVNISEKELISIINESNNDKTIHGIIVQMPLPKHINETNIKNSISVAKDVDGFHPMSKFKACTPKGIIDYLKAEDIELASKNAVVIGRSNIVGKPVAQLLLNENCNVTILHSKTLKADMNMFLLNADIIVVATGKKHLISEQKLKKSAVLIDVGINRSENGLCGDAKPNLDIRLQTPVPGGIGLITRVTLLKNLVEAYKNGI